MMNTPTQANSHRPLFSDIEEIVADIGAGKMVIMMDDENRENEGDLMIAAEMVGAEDINFMARFGRGLICLTITRERFRQLGLSFMVDDTDERQATNFAVSIEAAEGISSGVSAGDRARTIQVAVAANALPGDLTQPGHVFPLVEQNGGVLTRPGHTEAACDLARLAGLEPAAAIVEVLNEDGSMARRADLQEFSRVHGVKLGSIADLIAFRQKQDHAIASVSCA